MPGLEVNEILQAASWEASVSENETERARQLALALRARKEMARRTGAISPQQYARRRSWARDWSSAQQEAIEAIVSLENRHVVLVGPVRSGKTEAAVAGFLERMAWRPDAAYGLIVRSQAALDRMRHLIEEWAWELWWPVERRDSHLRVGPVRVDWCIGAHDRSHESIKGSTWAGALVDEASELPRPLIDEITARCSADNATIVYSTNPADPVHPFKTGLRDKIEAGEVAGQQIRFSLADAPWLSVEYIADLHARYQGPILRWYVHGEDAALTGLVYPRVDEAVADRPKPRPDHWFLSVDVGYSSSSTHGVLIGIWEDKAHVVSEWRHSGDETGRHLSYAEQPALVADWLFGLIGDDHVQIMVDQAERQWLREAGRIFGEQWSDKSWRLVDAHKRQVNAGIRACQALLSDGRLRIDPTGAPHLLREMRTLRWREDAARRGEEKPTVGDDHGADALRYWSDAWENRGFSAWTG